MPKQYRQCSFCPNNLATDSDTVIFTVNSKLLAALESSYQKTKYICEITFLKKTLELTAALNVFVRGLFPYFWTISCQILVLLQAILKVIVQRRMPSRIFLQVTVKYLKILKSQTTNLHLVSIVIKTMSLLETQNLILKTRTLKMDQALIWKIRLRAFKKSLKFSL